jgi:hypothetical protein
MANMSTFRKSALTASREFGQTPPPADGSIVACPTCVNGRKRIGLHRLACTDCMGSGVRGYGFSALRVFEEWLDNLPGGDSEDGVG